MFSCPDNRAPCATFPSRRTRTHGFFGTLPIAKPTGILASRLPQQIADPRPGGKQAVYFSDLPYLPPSPYVYSRGVQNVEFVSGEVEEDDRREPRAPARPIRHARSHARRRSTAGAIPRTTARIIPHDRGLGKHLSLPLCRLARVTKILANSGYLPDFEGMGLPLRSRHGWTSRNHGDARLAPGQLTWCPCPLRLRVGSSCDRHTSVESCACTKERWL